MLIVLLMSMLVLAFVSNLIHVYATGSQSVEEFTDNILFRKPYLSLPTWELDETWDFAVGVVGAEAYFSLGECYIRLPTTVKAKYDTTIRKGDTNTVDMSIDTYNSDGLEFEFRIGFEASLTWDPVWGDKTTLGEVDYGFSLEKDFTPPLGGDKVCLASDDLSASLELCDCVKLEIGLEVRLEITGNKVFGDYWLDDDYCVDHDIDPSGVVMTTKDTYTEQFSIEQTQLSGTDGYVDFGVNRANLMYRVTYTVKLDPYIKFEIKVDGIHEDWTWYLADTFGHPGGFPIWEKDDDIPVDTENSDDLDYVMSRTVNVDQQEYDIPIFTIGPAEPLPGVIAGFPVIVDIPINQIAVDLPPSFTIDDTTIDIYYANGSLMKSVAITPTDFANKLKTISIAIPSAPVVGYDHIEFSLNTPVISNPPEYGHVTDVPAFSIASLMFTYQLPDLDIQRLDVVAVDYIEPSIAYEYAISVEVENNGTLGSPPSSVRLWLYDGIPVSHLDQQSMEFLISKSTLIGTRPLNFLTPGAAQLVTFYWHDVSWVGRYATFIAEVVQVMPEISDTNNRALATAWVMSRAHDIAINRLEPSKIWVLVGEQIHFDITVKNEGLETESFVVEFYAGESLIDSTTVASLSPGSTQDLVFYWAPECGGAGTYEFEALVPPISFEDDTIDNFYVCTVDVSDSVGGVWVPADKPGLLAPYIGLASTILVATVATAVYVKRVKRRKEKQ